MVIACFHCNELVSETWLEAQPDLFIRYQGEVRPVCCIGCKSVADFILGSEQSSYYQYREQSPEKIAPELLQQAHQWVYYDDKPEVWGNTYSKLHTNGHKLYLDIHGIHCSACTWLISNKLERINGVDEVAIDAATGVASIIWNSEKAQFSHILETITLLGYRPSLLGERISLDEGSDQELKRLVVAGLGMMQVMMYAVALYSGEWNGMEPIYRKFLIWVSLLVTTPVLFYSGLPFIKNALVSLKNRSAHMDIPVALAMLLAFTLSCVNFFRGQGSVYFDSVVMFVFFISAARFIQKRLQVRNMQTQQALTRMVPNFIAKQQNGTTEYTPANTIQKGDILSIAIGAVVPVDAELLSTKTEVEESLLTGESHPVKKTVGGKLFAGSINLNTAIRVKALSTASNSSLSILGQRLAANSLQVDASGQRSLQRHLAKFASAFVLCVLSVAGLTLYFWASRGQVEKGLEAALAVLVISCPCALSLAIPASLAALSQRLHRNGMHVMNSAALLDLSRIDTFMFDKTGTLTDVSFIQSNITLLKEDEFTKEQCSDLSVALEKDSMHPIARAFRELRSPHKVSEFVEHKGQGVSGIIDGVKYILAKSDYLIDRGVEESYLKSHSENSIFLAKESNGRIQLLATLNLEQKLRPDALATVQALQSLALDIQMVSGDRPQPVENIAKELGITVYFSQHSSQQKKQWIETQQKKERLVAAVGDGINDAEVLNAANVSVSFTHATHVAQANSDVLLAGRSLKPLLQLVLACRKLKRVVSINIFWALTYNIFLIPLAAMAYIQPWMAALGMSLSSLFVVLNASRLRNLPEVR